MNAMFIDTNVFVYASFKDSPNYQKARRILDKAFLGTEPVRISNQVIREFIAVVSRPQKWTNAMPIREALQRAENIRNMCDVLEDSQEVLMHWMKICREMSVAGQKVHDANIVATMLAYGEKQLLTFDSDFGRFTPMIDLVEIE